MSLVRRIPKPARRSERWRSPGHLAFVRKHACVACDSESGIEAAHVRLGSGAGMGQKPDDWRAVPLCRDCHAKQHTLGEMSFWVELGIGAEPVIEELIKASPKRAEIAAERASRG